MGRGTGWKDKKDRLLKEVGKVAANAAEKLGDHLHKTTVSKEEWQKEKELRQIKQENERADRIKKLEADRYEQIRIREERESKAAAEAKAAEEARLAQEAADAEEARAEAEAEKAHEEEVARLEAEVAKLAKDNEAAAAQEAADKAEADRVAEEAAAEVNVCAAMPVDGSCAEGYNLSLAGDCCELV
ncbi:MAG: hypothetical protein WBJ81_05865 [Rickettsiales bacterium]